MMRILCKMILSSPHSPRVRVWCARNEGLGAFGVGEDEGESEGEGEDDDGDDDKNGGDNN